MSINLQITSNLNDKPHVVNNFSYREQTASNR